MRPYAAPVGREDWRRGEGERDGERGGSAALPLREEKIPRALDRPWGLWCGGHVS